MAHLHHPVDLLTLPPRWWKWRMRGGAVSLAEACAGLSTAPVSVLCSDMVDLPAFLTFARPHLGDAPVALYMHESQLTYPGSPRMEPDLHYAVTNWLSALAADRVVFNSRYHRDVFFAELPRLLRHFPDLTHEHRIPEVEQRSEVLEVGVELDWIPPSPRRRTGPIRLLWNHRWEHDKDPSAFFAAVDRLASEGLDFTVAVCGENFRRRPLEFTAAARLHPERIVHMGHLPTDDYRRHLLEADIVVSTALQEFFGISVVEGMAAGCLPVVPRRLSYPEIVPERYHDVCLYPPGGLVERLRWGITHPDEVRRLGRELAPEMTGYGWEAMAPRYEDFIRSLVEDRRLPCNPPLR